MCESAFNGAKGMYHNQTYKILYNTLAVPQELLSWRRAKLQFMFPYWTWKL